MKDIELRDEIVPMYLEQKLSTVQIGEIVGLTAGAVGSVLTSRGVKLRNSKEGFNTRFPKGRFGNIASNWKGGKHIYNGYYVVHILNHPRGGHNNRVFEHILVAEKKIGRYLTKDEVVHHINGDKQDNKAENLKVVKRGNHVAYHMHSGKSIQSLLKRIEYLEDLLKKNDVIFA